MKKIKCIILLAITMAITMTFLTVSTAHALWDGKKLRYAQERVARVERTEYTLRLWNAEILTWKDNEATPNFYGMPNGQYSISAIKKERNDTSFFYAYTHFNVPLTIEPELVFHMEEYANVRFVISDLPEGFSENDYSQHNVQLTGPNGSAWGQGTYRENTNELRVIVWTNVFNGYSIATLIDNNGEIVNMSFPDTNFSSAVLNNTIIEIEFEELIIGQGSTLNEYYAHERWLAEGIEDNIDEYPNDVRRYNHKAKEGDVLRIKVSGGNDPDIDIIDTMVRIVDPNGNFMLTNHPHYRGDGWIDDANDFGPHGMLYEDIRLAIPMDGTYTIFVKAFSSSRTGKFNLRVDNPENW